MNPYSLFVGYIIVASSTSIIIYGIGNSIYILGITGLFLLQNIIISDISSLRNRIIWCIFPNLPGAINVWVSGDVASSILATGYVLVSLHEFHRIEFVADSRSESYRSWRWGYGMFCVLTPVLAIPIIITLTVGMRETKAQLLLRSKKPLNFSLIAVKKAVLNVLWKLDIVGLVLLVVGAGLFLVAITLANGRTSRWYDGESCSFAHLAYPSRRGDVKFPLSSTKDIKLICRPPQLRLLLCWYWVDRVSSASFSGKDSERDTLSFLSLFCEIGQSCLHVFPGR